jgi:hypothetical protein
LVPGLKATNVILNSFQGNTGMFGIGGLKKNVAVLSFVPEKLLQIPMQSTVRGPCVGKVITRLVNGAGLWFIKTQVIIGYRAGIPANCPAVVRLFMQP